MHLHIHDFKFIFLVSKSFEIIVTIMLFENVFCVMKVSIPWYSERKWSPKFKATGMTSMSKKNLDICTCNPYFPLSNTVLTFSGNCNWKLNILFVTVKHINAKILCIIWCGRNDICIILFTFLWDIHLKYLYIWQTSYKYWYKLLKYSGERVRHSSCHGTPTEIQISSRTDKSAA